MVLRERIRALNSRPVRPEGSVLYWMSRDQRLRDNWALIHAYENAVARKVPFLICFVIADRFAGVHPTHFEFMNEGLRQIHHEAQKLHIPFFILKGDPSECIPAFVKKYAIGHVVCDFSPLRFGRKWRDTVASTIPVRFEEVDTHNIVPCWIASDKQEYNAFFFRKKIHALLPHFLDEYPAVSRFTFAKSSHLEAAQKSIQILKSFLSHGDQTLQIRSGESSARSHLAHVLKNTLSSYASAHNDPTKNIRSYLSGYLHFGQISAQFVASKIFAFSLSDNDREVFLEECIVRKELADNFCYYNQHYDTFEGFPGWAQQTLISHMKDPRPYTYSSEELEQARTHDAIWNAAQTEMVQTGSMHGYMRMYWAKKILEWTKTPQEAMHIAVYLNDKYELDGRDPNGYTGIAWSIGGVHDRPWFERLVFGTIRYMAASGLIRKYQINSYVTKWNTSLFAH